MISEINPSPPSNTLSIDPLGQKKVGPEKSAPEELSPERLKLREAAQGFEAIMVRKMLEIARESVWAEDAPLTGNGMKQYKTMRDEHFADITAQSGTLGFARSIEEQLAQFVSDTPEG